MSQKPPFCRHCNVAMVPGIAIPAALVTSDHGITSYGHWNGLAPLASVWKCSSCGHSFLPPAAAVLLREVKAGALATPTGRYCAQDDHLRYATRGKCALCGREFALHLNPANP